MQDDLLKNWLWITEDIRTSLSPCDFTNLKRNNLFELILTNGSEPLESWNDDKRVIWSDQGAFRHCIWSKAKLVSVFQSLGMVNGKREKEAGKTRHCGLCFQPWFPLALVTLIVKMLFFYVLAIFRTLNWKWGNWYFTLLIFLFALKPVNEEK